MVVRETWTIKEGKEMGSGRSETELAQDPRKQQE